MIVQRSPSWMVVRVRPWASVVLAREEALAPAPRDDDETLTELELPPPRLEALAEASPPPVRAEDRAPGGVTIRAP